MTTDPKEDATRRDATPGGPDAGRTALEPSAVEEAMPGLPGAARREPPGGRSVPDPDSEEAPELLGERSDYPLIPPEPDAPERR